MVNITNFVVLQVYRQNYGQYSFTSVTFWQDPEGRIHMQSPDGTVRGQGVVVDLDRKPNKNGFSAILWYPDIKYGFNTEFRVYFVDTDGGVNERCFSGNGGSNAVWYNGPLVGQFKAGPFSSIAATSDTKYNGRVYYQDAEKRIIEINRPGWYTFDEWKAVSRRPIGLQGTRIAVDSGTISRETSSIELLYQLPDKSWTYQGGRANFAPPFQYNAGAPITLAGGSNFGKAHVFTINSQGQLIVTSYDNDEDNWDNFKLVDNAGGISLASTSQPAGGSGHSTFVYFIDKNSESTNGISVIGFTSESSWGESPVIVVP